MVTPPAQNTLITKKPKNESEKDKLNFTVNDKNIAIYKRIAFNGLFKSNKSKAATSSSSSIGRFYSLFRKNEFLYTPTEDLTIDSFELRSPDNLIIPETGDERNRVIKQIHCVDGVHRSYIETVEAIKSSYLWYEIEDWVDKWINTNASCTSSCKKNFKSVNNNSSQNNNNNNNNNNNKSTPPQTTSKLSILTPKSSQDGDNDNSNTNSNNQPNWIVSPPSIDKPISPKLTSEKPIITEYISNSPSLQASNNNNSNNSHSILPLPFPPPIELQSQSDLSTDTSKQSKNIFLPAEFIQWVLDKETPPETTSSPTPNSLNSIAVDFVKINASIYGGLFESLQSPVNPKKQLHEVVRVRKKLCRGVGQCDMYYFWDAIKCSNLMSLIMIRNRAMQNLYTTLDLLLTDMANLVFTFSGDYGRLCNKIVELNITPFKLMCELLVSKNLLTIQHRDILLGFLEKGELPDKPITSLLMTLHTIYFNFESRISPFKKNAMNYQEMCFQTQISSSQPPPPQQQQQQNFIKTILDEKNTLYNNILNRITLKFKEKLENVDLKTMPSKKHHMMTRLASSAYQFRLYTCLIMYPMSLDYIKLKITHNQYTSDEQFIQDFYLIKFNALHAFGETDDYYKLANEIHRCIVRSLSPTETNINNNSNNQENNQNNQISTQTSPKQPILVPKSSPQDNNNNNNNNNQENNQNNQTSTQTSPKQPILIPKLSPQDNNNQKTNITTPLILKSPILVPKSPLENSNQSNITSNINNINGNTLLVKPSILIPKSLPKNEQNNPNNQNNNNQNNIILTTPSQPNELILIPKSPQDNNNLKKRKELEPSEPVDIDEPITITPRIDVTPKIHTAAAEPRVQEITPTLDDMVIALKPPQLGPGDDTLFKELKQFEDKFSEMKAERDKIQLDIDRLIEKRNVQVKELENELKQITEELESISKQSQYEFNELQLLGILFKVKSGLPLTTQENEIHQRYQLQSEMNNNNQNNNNNNNQNILNSNNNNSNSNNLIGQDRYYYNVIEHANNLNKTKSKLIERGKLKSDELDTILLSTNQRLNFLTADLTKIETEVKNREYARNLVKELLQNFNNTTPTITIPNNI